MEMKLTEMRKNTFVCNFTAQISLNWMSTANKDTFLQPTTPSRSIFLEPLKKMFEWGILFLIEPLSCVS